MTLGARSGPCVSDISDTFSFPLLVRDLKTLLNFFTATPTSLPSAEVAASLHPKPDSVWSQKVLSKPLQWLIPHFKNRCQESKGLRPQVKIKTHSQTQSFSLLFFPRDWLRSYGAVHMKSNLYKDECRRLVQFHESPGAEEGVRLEGEGPPGLILQDSTVKCCA